MAKKFNYVYELIAYLGDRLFQRQQQPLLRKSQQLLQQRQQQQPLSRKSKQLLQQSQQLLQQNQQQLLLLKRLLQQQRLLQQLLLQQQLLQQQQLRWYQCQLVPFKVNGPSKKFIKNEFNPNNAFPLNYNYILNATTKTID